MTFVSSPCNKNQRKKRMISYNSKGRSIVAGRKIIFHRNRLRPACRSVRPRARAFGPAAASDRCTVIMYHVVRRSTCLILQHRRRRHRHREFRKLFDRLPPRRTNLLPSICHTRRCFVSSASVNYRKSGTLVLDHATDNPIILR